MSKFLEDYQEIKTFAEDINKHPGQLTVGPKSPTACRSSSSAPNVHQYSGRATVAVEPPAPEFSPHQQSR
jgi:hypothetical protein